LSKIEKMPDELDDALTQIGERISSEPPARAGGRRMKRGGAGEWESVKSSAKALATSLGSLLIGKMRDNVIKVSGVFSLALLNGAKTGAVLEAASYVGGRIVAIATNASYVSMAILAAFAYASFVGAGGKIPTPEEADKYLANFISSPDQVMANVLQGKLRSNQRAAAAVQTAFTDLKVHLDRQKKDAEDIVSARARRAQARDEVRRIEEDQRRVADEANAAAAAIAAAAAAPAAAAPAAAAAEPSVLGQRGREEGKDELGAEGEDRGASDSKKEQGGRRLTSRRRRRAAYLPRQTRRSSSGRRRGYSRRRRE
jgi:hypothetical protein